MIEHTFEVPLVYYFKYLESKRHSKETSGVAVETVQVTIREADMAELPQAARYDNSSAPDGKETFRLGPDGFYKEVHMSRYSGDRNQYLLSQELVEFSQNGTTYANALFNGQQPTAYERYQRGEARDPASVAVIKSSDREQALATLTDRARNLLVMDGRLLERFEIPVLFVSRGSSWVTVDVGDRKKFADKPQAQIFPLNQFDEASAFAMEHFRRPLDERDRVEILLPNVFDFDDVTPAVLELLSQSVVAHKKDIGSFDKDTMIVWADFRDAVSKAITSKTEEDIEVAIECGNLYRANPLAYESATSKLDAAIERWAMRGVPAMTL
jgi:hypothetical protein